MSMLASLLVLVGCGAAASPGRPSLPAVADSVGVYTSSPRTFETNAFFIEGDDGVVLIDTMFTPGEGLAALRHAEAVTGKPVVLAIVLHANPDKFNGTAALQHRGVRVITSRQVRSLIPEVFALRTSWFGDRYAPDWPDDTPTPDSFGSETRELRVAGLTLKLHVLGPAVSEAHVAVEWQGNLFVGDLVAHGHHGWLELGEAGPWLERLEHLRNLAPRRIHPGRGASAGPELIDAMASYLRDVESVVRDARPRLPLANAEVEALCREVERRHPELKHGVFLRVGVPALYRRHAGGGAPAAGSERLVR